MKRFISIALFLCVLVSLQAQEIYTTQNIPKVHLQDKTRYVCNPAGILSASACDEIDRMLYALEQQTGIETVVAVVPSIGNEDCFDFSHRLLNEWGVGKQGKNNGLVILLVTDQRCIQFYTGYGLEGDLPDAICKRIQTRDMIPYLKDGNWDAGMVAGVRAVCARLDGSMVNDSDEDGGDSPIGLILAVVGFFAIAIAAGPGSFTGLRIGIAAVKGLAWAADKPCLGVSTLEAMAQNAAHIDGLIVGAMDARRSQVYNAVFEAKGGELTRLTPDRAISLEALCAQLQGKQQPITVLGDGGVLCYRYLEEHGVKCSLAPSMLLYQSAVGVGLAAERAYARGEAVSAQELLPVYLRPAQAERLRSSKLNQ